MSGEDIEQAPPERVALATIGREWLRLGCIGFGGPPTHIALLRRLCVEERQWIEAKEFEDAIATTNLLPGPASTQLAIYCAWRLRGRAGQVGDPPRQRGQRAGIAAHLVAGTPRARPPAAQLY